MHFYDCIFAVFSKLSYAFPLYPSSHFFLFSAVLLMSAREVSSILLDWALPWLFLWMESLKELILKVIKFLSLLLQFLMKVLKLVKCFFNFSLILFISSFVLLLNLLEQPLYFFFLLVQSLQGLLNVLDPNILNEALDVRLLGNIRRVNLFFL